MSFLIDRILPSKRVHLLAGISSSGKSRFIVPALKAFEKGLPVIGLTCRPVPWVLVCADRPLEDAEDMIASLGYTTDEISIIPAFGNDNKPTYQIIDEIKKRGAKLVLWEGFDFMVKNPNSPGEVREFLSKMTGYCQDGLTILGTVGVAKLKPHEVYQNPRQLVGGSSIWERATSTDLILQAINPKDISDPRRMLYVSLKNFPSFQVNGQFDESGALIFQDWTTAGSPENSPKVKYQ